MREIPSNDASIDEICQNTFNLIKIHRNVKPLEYSTHLLQRDLMLFGHSVDALKEAAIAHGSASFKKQVCTLSTNIFCKNEDRDYL